MHLLLGSCKGVMGIQVIFLMTALWVSSFAMQLDEPCRAVIQEISGGQQNGDELLLVCETPSGMIYKVKNVSSSVMDLVKKSTRKADTEMILQFDETAQINVNTQEIESTTPPQLIESIRSSPRNLAVVTGTKSILVVRIVASGVGPSPSELALSDSVFGNNADGDGADPINVKSQYAACSHGKINFVEANDRNGNSGVNIRNGTVTISVSTSVNEQDYVIRNAVTTTFYNLFGVYPNAVADHVMYCMPPGSMDTIAYAFVDSYLSVYSDLWCTYVSAQMHEIGHNLNLDHSGEGSNDYGDQSGVMGFSYSNNDSPLMCFNAAKSWQLGWYSSRHLTLSLNEGYYGDLGSLVHNDSDPMPAIIKINNNSSPTDLYVTFNWKHSFNSGTEEGGNQVMVVETGEEGQGYSRSNLLGKQSVESRGYILGGQIVSVTVNSINLSTGYANVEICYGNCAPTSMPSRKPTSNPSDKPTQRPSSEESSNPTYEPSSNPSHEPSGRPSRLPTHLPSFKPSFKPSQNPSIKPSSSPSTTISLHPTHLPSKEISSVPSQRQSSSPSRNPSYQTITSLNPTLYVSPQPSLNVSFPTTNAPSETNSSLTTVSPTNSSSMRKVSYAILFSTFFTMVLVCH